MRITVKFGLNEITKQVDDDTTVSDVVGDSGIQAVLGNSGNVDAYVHDGPLDSDDSLSDGDVLELRQKVNTKAQS